MGGISNIGYKSLLLTPVSASGTNQDFTALPSWAKKISVLFAGVSTNGTSPIQIQLGTSSGIDILGYTDGAWIANTSNANSTTGFLVSPSTGAGAYAFDGISELILLNSSSNLWVFNSVHSGSTSGINSIGGGAKSLSGILDRIRITTVLGVDTFDAGTFNLLIEG